MGKKMEGAILNEAVTGVTLRGMILRWAIVFLLVCGVCMWAGCGGGSNDDSGSSDNNEDTSDTSGKTGAYSQNGGIVTESGKTYAATATDESAVYVYGGGVYSLTDGTLTKTGATSSAEDSNFYGNNAIVLAEDASEITLTNCTLSADSEGSNGAFAYGEGSVVTLDGCTINTTGDSARGVDATYGGKIYINDSTIETGGAHCGALASDRYENNDPPEIHADGVTATTAGDGSPGIYCTGTFVISNSETIATGSEAAAIEGKNSITLTDTSISGARKWGVIIYQSMSGDSSEGTGTFTMTGGTLTNNFADGPAFFVCDTDAVINLSGATIINSSDMLLVAGKASTASGYIDNVNSNWGTLGGVVEFTAEDEALEGEIIICDSSSSLDLTLINSTYSGAINADNNTGTIDVTIDAGSTWTVTGTSYIKSLTNNGTITGTGTLYVNDAVYPY